MASAFKIFHHLFTIKLKLDWQRYTTFLRDSHDITLDFHPLCENRSNSNPSKHNLLAANRTGRHLPPLLQLPPALWVALLANQSQSTLDVPHDCIDAHARCASLRTATNKMEANEKKLMDPGVQKPQARDGAELVLPMRPWRR